METHKKPASSWRAAKALFATLRPYSRWFYPGLIALLLASVLSLAFPYFLGKIVGLGFQDDRPPETLQQEANVAALSLLCILALQAGVAFFRIRWFAKAGESAIADLSEQTFAALLRLPITFFHRNRVGELSSRLSADLGLIRETMIGTVPQVVRQVVVLLGGLVLLFVMSSKLALVMLACFPLVMLSVGFWGRKIRLQTRQSQDELAAANVVAEEALHGIQEVKAFGNEAFESSRYREALERFLGFTLSAAHSKAAFVSFIIFALFGVITYLVWFASGELRAGTLDSERFAAFIIYNGFVGGALAALPEALGQMQKAIGATDRIREILEEEAEPTGQIEPEGGAFPPLAGALSFEGVSFHYPSRPEVAVLQSLHFQVAPGEKLALVGPSGAGKSTLVSLLLRFFEPSLGVIRFDGMDAREVPLAALRASMALVPQEVLLFGGTIEENIRYGRIGASAEEVREAARQAFAHDFIEDFPDGYRTIVGDRGVRLSGGQRQRIAIARAILADPSLLLLDEATSALDSESEQMVQQALENLMKGRTSIIIAHRLATVKSADRILVLQRGQMVESGKHAELIQDENGLYRLLAEMQFGEQS
ncbi:MAG: ABC transporter transmembrane domain-containing protein [Verrucomicrobiota bacterium]